MQIRSIRRDESAQLSILYKRLWAKINLDRKWKRATSMRHINGENIFIKSIRWSDFSRSIFAFEKLLWFIAEPFFPSRRLCEFISSGSGFLDPIYLRISACFCFRYSISLFRYQITLFRWRNMNISALTVRLWASSLQLKSIFISKRLSSALCPSFLQIWSMLKAAANKNGIL